MEAGLVRGIASQAIDSAPVKANASMDRLEIKVPAEDLDEHLSEVSVQSSRDRKAKGKSLLCRFYQKTCYRKPTVHF